MTERTDRQPIEHVGWFAALAVLGLVALLLGIIGVVGDETARTAPWRFVADLSLETPA